MGADYKAPGRHLSPLRPAVRCRQPEDVVLSTIVDMFALLLTVGCIWILSHGVPRQQVQSFVNGIFAVVWWGFLRNQGVKGICRETLLATAFFPLEWMPRAVATATTIAISPGTSSSHNLEFSLPLQFFVLTFCAILFSVTMMYHYGPHPASAMPSTVSQVCPHCGMFGA